MALRRLGVETLQLIVETGVQMGSQIVDHPRQIGLDKFFRSCVLRIADEFHFEPLERRHLAYHGHVDKKADTLVARRAAEHPQDGARHRAVPFE